MAEILVADAEDHGGFYGDTEPEALGPASGLDLWHPACERTAYVWVFRVLWPLVCGLLLVKSTNTWHGHGLSSLETASIHPNQ